MRFALFENNKIEAAKGAKGFCSGCGSELIPRCGDFKIKHWAHKGNRNCDPWWENETDWHRSWKNNFPVDWQEFSFTDKLTNEKHIADVHTNHGLVIEFQHSHINPQERISREKFYKDMIWVVDGTRLKRDYTRFLKAQKDILRTNHQGRYLVQFPDECFPTNWLGSLVPVIFDFRGMDSISEPNDLRNFLFCLLPNKERLDSTLVILPRESFVNSVINGELLEKHEKQQVPQNQPLQQLITIKRREPTHNYDPRKGRFVKRKRF